MEVSYFVLWTYIEEKVLGSDNLESYLNTIKTKHSIYHTYSKIQCCKCETTKNVAEKLISKKQFQMLYECDENKSLSVHEKFVKGRLVQKCICCYSAVQNVNVRIFDITLANILIKTCGMHPPGLDMWMRTITEIRNEIFHLSDIQEMTDHKFNLIWQKLEGSIMGIANLLQKNQPNDIQREIEIVKRLEVFSDQELKYERLCRDYWNCKCAEFEVLFICLRHIDFLCECIC